MGLLLAWLEHAARLDGRTGVPEYRFRTATGALSSVDLRQMT
jgi:hypothetical protein